MLGIMAIILSISLIQFCCDGGVSCNMPFSSDPEVITVSPFSGECDICPTSDNESYYQTYLMQQTVHISVDNIYRGIAALLFLPWSEMESLFQQGYDDTLTFLRKEGNNGWERGGEEEG